MRHNHLIASAVLTCLALVGAFASNRAAAHPGAGHHSHAIHTDTWQRAGDWKLLVQTDAFTQDKTCRLRSRDGRSFYIRDALGFRFGSSADVLRASFRVDDGPVMRWRDQLPELARLRVPIDGRDMTSPTDGIIWIPADLIEGASTVAIQPRPGRKAQVFSLGGFADLRAMAADMGCLSNGRFVQ